MKAKKYNKVETLPAGAVTVSNYAKMTGQKNPSYICVAYDRYCSSPDRFSNPGYVIVNWQGFNFVVPQ